MKNVLIYCDGSANNSTGEGGGYGIYIENLVKPGESLQFAGGQYIQTSSDRMELLAALKALEKCFEGQAVQLVSDNQYLIHSFTKRWIFRWEEEKWRNRKNRDLLEKLLFQYRRLSGKVNFQWVRGHNKNDRNEIADALAKLGGKSKNMIVDNKE